MKQTSNVISGPRHQLRLEDLRDWHAIEVTCFACAHKGRVPYPWLRQYRLLNTRLVELEKKYVCKCCGNRRANMWRVVMGSQGAARF